MPTGVISDPHHLVLEALANKPDGLSPTGLYAHFPRADWTRIGMALAVLEARSDVLRVHTKHLDPSLDYERLVLAKEVRWAS